MNESSRQERIIRTSVIGILVNLLIAAVKIMIGTLASSIAIVSEGINNATDAGSSFLTYIGTKLSGKHPDEKHPFGYGRIEYLTGMVVGVLILYAGLGMLKESVEGILHPSDMNVSILTVLIVAGTAVAASSLKNTAVLAFDLANNTPVVVAPVRSSATAPIKGMMHSSVSIRSFSLCTQKESTNPFCVSSLLLSLYKFMN